MTPAEAENAAAYRLIVPAVRDLVAIGVTPEIIRAALQLGLAIAEGGFDVATVAAAVESALDGRGLDPQRN